jgi:hypothetical protein
MSSKYKPLAFRWALGHDVWRAAVHGLVYLAGALALILVLVYACRRCCVGTRWVVEASSMLEAADHM